MSRKGSFDFKEKLASLKKLKQTLPREVGEITANFFQDNFTKQGFDDNGVNPWKPRKSKKDSGRAILVKSGKLRRSIRLRSATFNKIVIGTNIKYAQIHNEGGTIAHGARESVIHFRKVDELRKMGKNGKLTSFMGSSFSKKKGSHFAQKVSIGAHDSVMPKRQFIGNSRNLEKKQRAYMKIRLDKILGR